MVFCFLSVGFLSLLLFSLCIWGCRLRCLFFLLFLSASKISFSYLINLSTYFFISLFLVVEFREEDRRKFASADVDSVSESSSSSSPRRESTLVSDSESYSSSSSSSSSLEGMAEDVGEEEEDEEEDVEVEAISLFVVVTCPCSSSTSSSSSILFSARFNCC
ncbi:ORF100 [White spot syndrome virus]|uniref:ORF100 n=1 Tax=White spot syndrome virus TaxID=342409 RepID=A0A2D3I533_9VIRU|nr:ORF100 [White spot syndrome virus]